MDLIYKIKKHGIKESGKIVAEHLINALNHMVFTVCKLFPIDEKLIVLESEGDLADNAYAIYDYMRKNDMLSEYKVVWLVENVEMAQRKVAKNVKCVVKYPKVVAINRDFYLATCRWYIFDHCNVMSQWKKRTKQKLTYLSHGWGYKAAKGTGLKKDVTGPDYITATGELSAKGLSDYWNEPMEKILITGYPRIDYLYEYNDDVSKQVNEKWKFDTYNKIFFWMPTFRQSKSAWLSEDYLNNQTGLPIFETLDSLQEFSEFLVSKNILLVFKLHHLQAELPVFKKKFQNILIVRDTDLYLMDVQLYQIIRFADAVISDYSSIMIDYMTMDRPLVYTLDDYINYDNSRGLYPANAIDYMPGYHVYNVAELEESIEEISIKKMDKFKAERQRVKRYYHKYADGNSAKRVLEGLGIVKDAVRGKI